MDLDTRQHKLRMMQKPGKPRATGMNALTIAGAYAALGCLWILFSDSVAGFLIPDPGALHAVGLAKGIGYVLATAMLLYYLVSRALKAETAYSRKLDECYDALHEDYHWLETGRRELAESEELYRKLYTEREQMEQALAEETEQLRVTLDSIGDGVLSADTGGVVTMANGVAEQLTGWHNGAAVGMKLSEVLEIYGERSDAAFASAATAVFGKGEPAEFMGNIRIRSRDGVERILSGRAAPLKGAGGKVLGLVFVFRDVTEQHRREEEIRYLSYHDTLTGLYNRAFFEEELKRLDTERQLPLSVIMGDANNLKLVNDVFGHSEGDELIKAMAQVLRESCRAEDIISRWGGDEFTILLPRTPAEVAGTICRRIAERCRRFQAEGKGLNPSLSLGYETKVSADTDIQQVIKAAEDMMYKNKLLDSRTANNEFLMTMRIRIGSGELEGEAHTSRVSELCDRVGRELNLKENGRADLKTLSLLHDIGKAAIDTWILNKPGSLTDAEWEEIKRHSGIGYRIVRSAPELVLVADYILGHHERWDGHGYPQGLKGEAIPLPSRILAVVEAFDVMTHGRPYKPAVGAEEALREIFRNSGTQFDPEVVNAFASVLHSLTDGIGFDNSPAIGAGYDMPTGT